MQRVDQYCKLDPTPINFSITLFCPVSSVAGSGTIILTQPLLIGKVENSAGIIIALHIFLYLFKLIFELETSPSDIGNELDAKVQIPLSNLNEFIETTTQNSSSPSGSDQLITPGQRGFLTVERPEAPMLIGIYVNGIFSNLVGSPYTGMILPIISLPGIRGALPMIILGILASIFVRAVVPPETTGSQPLKLNKINRKKFNFSPEELVKLMDKFGRYFSK